MTTTAHSLEIDRLNRLYSALSRINQAIVRHRAPEDLFHRICEVLVEHAGFGMAWIGWYDPKTHRLLPVAQAGDENGYLQSIEVYGSDRVEGRGPSGRAFRENRPYVCNDVFEDPAMLPWRAEFERRGLAASAAFPIHANGGVGGTLSVYATQKGVFRDKEVALLVQAAADISFALDNLEREESRRRAEALDMAERQRGEEAVKRSEERYRTTLETILEGCQLLAFDWRYLYLNPAAAIQNRRPNSELLGHRMPDVWPGIEQSEVFGLLRKCMEERVHLHTEVEFSFPDGAAGWFDVRAQPVPEGIFVLSIDISERKRAEQALRELNEHLERKVAERTRDLEAAREQAEDADRLKSAFLATMSHELRTPLNSILGFTGIVLKGMAGPLNAEQTKQLGMVQVSARHLLDLINDVLDISKIEAGQLEIRRARFDLLASIKNVTASLMPLAEKKALTLRVVVPESMDPMESDRRRVEQILLNLYNNAIKFTDRGDVTLTVDVVERETRRFVRFRVADTGIGMKPEDLSKLFQPFRQIDSGLQRQHEGTGLGLAICRRLTLLLGGTIQAESSWGEGSVFSVELPLEEKGAA
jgi:PAS domain S-box-containing protein